uniref:TLC domain-containing protein n=1 Tax=Prymnesium polylepis TaxID=72548 RepID=A0A7S4K0C2_9EUKA
MLGFGASKNAAAAAAATAPGPMYPDPMIMGTTGGLLFTIHTVVWLLLISYGQQSRAEAHLGAHFVAVLLGFSALAAVGVYGWLLFPEPHPEPNLVMGVTFAGNAACNMMTAFQTYEVTLSLIAPMLRGKHYEMIGHHVVTLALAVMGGVFSYLDHQAVFFFGFSELSSIPLSVVDLMKQYPGLPSRYPQLHELSRTLFAVSFLAVRVLYWPIVSYRFWADSLPQLGAGFVPMYVAYSYLVSNILLTGLQFFWGSLILRALAKMAKGGKGGKASKAE